MFLPLQPANEGLVLRAAILENRKRLLFYGVINFNSNGKNMNQSAPVIASYESRAIYELRRWQKKMMRKPSIIDAAAKNLQTRTNRIIPEKAHQAIAAAVKYMTRMAMSGSGLITRRMIISDDDLETRENKIRERIRFYRSTAAAEGAATGYAGFITGLADLPLWLSIKMKMLFEIAAHYGFDTADYRERIYILNIFQLAFSSQGHRNKIFRAIADWGNESKRLPGDMNRLDWRAYWEEYRDHIDLAKLLQLIPGFGAAVGAVVNYRLTGRLGEYAMNAYRMRKLKWQSEPELVK